MINWDMASSKTPGELSLALAAQTSAKLYLADTAWYHTRAIELGTPMPDEIVKGRANAYKILEAAQ